MGSNEMKMSRNRDLSSVPSIFRSKKMNPSFRSVRNKIIQSFVD